MKISEIFTSIQGESTYAGLPCIFIRLSGCNLRCSYCDTTYAYNGGFNIYSDQIIKKVRASNVKLVEITGGEPLIQKETEELLDRLISEKYSVLIETNGSKNIKALNKDAVIIMDIKTPSSSMSNRMNLENINYLKPSDEVKLVIRDRIDYEWSLAIVKRYSLVERCKVLFSPVFSVLEPEFLSRWILEDCLDVRLNLQIHKYINCK